MIEGLYLTKTGLDFELSRYVNLRIVSLRNFGNRLASVTNDIDPQYDTDFHMDATDFLNSFKPDSVDMVLYDPPYSPRQVAECYKALGITVNMQTTQASY